MACFYPQPAFRTESGDVVFVERGAIHASLTLACGRCIGCRAERARQWTVRVMYEASKYEDNCFLTLTYDDAHLPADGSLVYPHYQRFMKYLRKEVYPRRVRFTCAGNTGSNWVGRIFTRRFLIMLSAMIVIAGVLLIGVSQYSAPLVWSVFGLSAVLRFQS